MNQKPPRPWSRMPIAFLLMGLLSATLLIWINEINERQDNNFIFADVIVDIQLKAATSHLWLEEVISGETTLDAQRVWNDMDDALSLAEALLKGGKSDNGLAVLPIENPDMRSRMEDIKSLLISFEELAVERHRDPQLGAIGTEMDERFDTLFEKLLHEAKELETVIENKQVKNHIESKRLFVGILLVWTSIVVVAARMLWSREAKKRLAEDALRKAKEDLEMRVEERTLELLTANSHLQSEVAERKRAEEDIKLYVEVVKNMPIGLYVWRMEHGEDEEDPNLKLVAANPVATRSAEATGEDDLGKTVSESFLGILEAEIPQVFEEVTRSGKAKDLDRVYYGNEHDTECFFSVKAFPLPNRSVGVMFENITDRKRAENALRESESKFRSLSMEFTALLDAIPDSITLLSPDLVMLWSNRGAAKVADGETCGRSGGHCYAVRYGLANPCTGCPAMMSYLTGKPESAIVSASDGTCWDVRAFPIRNEAGRITKLLELAIDITEKISLQAEAMRAAHLASIGELAAGVAHEINNPINGIINYAEILSEELGEGTRANGIANRIIKEGVRIAGIVNGLLSFARDRKEDKEPVSVAGILSDALALTESQLRKNGIKLMIDVQDGLPDINVNPQQIQQVFLNIINNGRYALNQKFPGENLDKIIEISCKEIVIDERPHLSMTFHDHGNGIPPDILDKIMNPFFSTKPVGKGTGLGLSISHGIISDHGGKLTISSIDGEFTKVEILLPAGEKDHG
jgi:signal transduction histidine kinase/PAS domain-containing protein